MGKIKKKARTLFEAFSQDFPHKRKFNGNVYYLYKVKRLKKDAADIAKNERAKGYYIRITYNTRLKKYFIWRG